MMRMHTCGDAMRDSAFAFQAGRLLVPSEFQRKAQLQDLQRLKRIPNKLGARQAWVGDWISITPKKQSHGKMQGKVTP